MNLGELLLLPDEEITRILKDKIIIVGDFMENDMHDPVRDYLWTVNSHQCLFSATKSRYPGHASFCIDTTGNLFIFIFPGFSQGGLY